MMWCVYLRLFAGVRLPKVGRVLRLCHMLLHSLFVISWAVNGPPSFVLASNELVMNMSECHGTHAHQM